MSGTSATKARKGFNCPMCSVPLRIIKTRQRANGIVSRRRRCPSCGLVVQTEERPRSASTERNP